MATLFLVLRGEQYEGGHYQGVYSTEERARAKVMELISRSRVRPNDQWVERGHNRWVKGCDYITIEPNEIADIVQDTVYLIMHRVAYEGTDCKGIYSTMEEARGAIIHILERLGIDPASENDGTWDDSVSIESWVIDDNIEEIKEPENY
jgi:hypothetical protein